DDVGQDGVAAYGVSPGPPTTPTLDGLVERGVRFTRAYAYPVCSPSRAALLTGQYVRRLPWSDDGRLSRSARTLAELARDAGYETALFGKWHLSGSPVRGPRDPLRHGFDHFVGLAGNPDDTHERWGPPRDYFRWERNDDGRLSLSTDYAPTVTIDAAIDWIADREGPWFATVSLTSAHGPMHVPPDDLHTTDVTEDSPEPDLFRAVVEAGDTELGRLLDALGPQGLDDTVVIVVGDNGTDVRRDDPGFRVLGGKVSVFEGGIRVPLVVTGPPVEEPGLAHDGLVHLVDVAPTIAMWIGGDVGASDGRSLVEAVRDPARPGERDTLYTEFYGPATPPFVVDRRVVVSERLKLVDNAHEGTQVVTRLALDPSGEEEVEPDALTPDERAELERLVQALGRTLATFPEGWLETAP
ncbi:MAG: sulfatase-like hydrolase/transferase, partial [Myxococcota bacterium]